MQIQQSCYFLSQFLISHDHINKSWVVLWNNRVLYLLVGSKGSVLSVEVREDHHRRAVKNYSRWRTSWHLRRGEEWPDNVQFHNTDLCTASSLLAGQGFHAVSGRQSDLQPETETRFKGTVDPKSKIQINLLVCCAIFPSRMFCCEDNTMNDEIQIIPEYELLTTGSVDYFK